MIKVDIVDSCPIYATGLMGILTSEGFQVLGARTTATGAFSWRADVFLIDPDAVAVEYLASARSIAPVLLLGDAADPGLLSRYQQAGAAGFVDRRTDVEGLVTAVRALVNGGDFWTAGQPPACQQLPDPDSVALSPRERQVLRQIAHGLTHGQVARRLGISPHTVDTYVKRIRSKLDIGNKAELTRAAVLGSHDADT